MNTSQKKFSVLETISSIALHQYTACLTQLCSIECLPKNVLFKFYFLRNPKACCIINELWEPNDPTQYTNTGGGEIANWIYHMQYIEKLTDAIKCYRRSCKYVRNFHVSECRRSSCVPCHVMCMSLIPSQAHKCATLVCHPRSVLL